MIRPPNDRREVSCFTSELCLTSRRPTCSTSKLHQWLGSRCGTKNLLRHFPHPSPKYFRGQKSEIWPRLATTVTFEAIWFRNSRATDRNYKKKQQAPTVDLCYPQIWYSLAHFSLGTNDSLTPALPPSLVLQWSEVG